MPLTLVDFLPLSKLAQSNSEVIASSRRRESLLLGPLAIDRHQTIGSLQPER